MLEKRVKIENYVLRYLMHSIKLRLRVLRDVKRRIKCKDFDKTVVVVNCRQKNSGETVTEIHHLSWMSKEREREREREHKSFTIFCGSFSISLLKTAFCLINVSSSG